MADKTSIAFGLKIDGVEQSIKSVKDLKSAIKSLQDEAESSDIGSEQYKNAIENIEKLNEKLQEVTRTEKQAAKATEDLANAEKEAAKETGDLRKQFEVLEDELFMLAGQGKQNSAEFKKLTIEAANLNKKIDDVNQSLSGGGAERAEGGFSKLSDSLGKLDFKGVAQGAKMMGTALAATGVMLIVKMVGYLIENFDELSKGSGGLAKALRFVGDIIGQIISMGTDLLNFVTDFIGLTSESERAMEAQGEAMVNASKKSKEALAEQVKGFDNQIAAAKAAGKDTVQLEIEKQKAIIETNKKIAEQIIAFVASGGQLTDEQKKLFDESVANIKAAKQAEDIIIITADKAADDKAAERAKESKTKRDAEYAIRLAESDAFWNAELALQEEYRKEEYILNKKAEDDQLALEERQRLQDEAMVAGTQARNEQARLDKEAKDKAAADLEIAQLKALEASKFDIIRNGLNNVQKLTDLYFFFKSQNAEKGSKQELELAKKAFNVNKALQLAIATNDGVESVLKAFKSAQGSPITPFFPAFPFVQATLAGVFAAGNIAKIASSKFDAGGGGATGGGGGAAPMPSIPAPPTIATSSNNTNQSTTFDESGKNLNQTQPQINVTATVGVDEIAKKSNRVSVLENQSTF